MQKIASSNSGGEDANTFSGEAYAAKKTLLTQMIEELNNAKNKSHVSVRKSRSESRQDRLRVRRIASTEI